LYVFAFYTPTVDYQSTRSSPIVNEKWTTPYTTGFSLGSNRSLPSDAASKCDIPG